MKRFFLIVLLAAFQAANCQSFQVPKYEVGLGYAFKHQEGFGIPRVTFAVNEFFNGGGKGLIGAYTTMEYRSGIEFKEDGTNYYLRMPVGLNFSLPKFPAIQAFAGADFISYAAGKNLRKEIGFRYAVQNMYSFRLSYSNWVGLAFSVGYQFPIKGEVAPL